MYRSIEKQINNWIDEGKKALLVDGARQVGKTYCIRKCLKDSNSDYLEINLIENPEIADLLTNSKKISDLEFNLSVATGYQFKKNKSILFIDEVQECKEIITLIKFWVDDGSYRFILSGSLLGVEMRDLRSAPVGYVSELHMYPMNFEEFLIATGLPENTLSTIRQNYADRKPLEEAVHLKLLELFKRYLVIGGMPEAVAEYITSGDINKVDAIQKAIISQYRRDFTKYEAKEKKLMLEAVYDLVPSELLKQNRRFIVADLDKKLKFERVENSFLWHLNSGVLLGVYNSSEPKIPLLLNKQSNLVKLYFSDVGLLTCMYGNHLRTGILADAKGINLGGIYENAIAQELKSHGIELFYYNSHKLGELDFTMEYEGHILPIEVKSGKDYYVHSAVNNVLGSEEFDIQEAIVFSNYNISEKNNIFYCPIYMAMFLQERSELPVLKPIVL